MLQQKIEYEKGCPRMMTALCFIKTVGKQQVWISSAYCRNKCPNFLGETRVNEQDYINCKGEK